MKSIFVQVVACVLIVSMLFAISGCFGSFNLTKKVYKFNEGVGGKWVQELVFLVMVIVPVYGVATFIDAIVLNTIEFWTGENPVSAAVIDDREAGVTVSIDPANGTTRYLQNSPGDHTEYNFERTDNGTVVKDQSGKTVLICQATDDGGILVKDAAGRTTATYTKEDIENLYNSLTSAE